MTYVTWAPSLASLATEPPAENSGSSGCADTTSTRSYLSALALGLAIVLRTGFREVFFAATRMRVRDASRRLLPPRYPPGPAPRRAYRRDLAGGPNELRGIAG